MTTHGRRRSDHADRLRPGHAKRPGHGTDIGGMLHLLAPYRRESIIAIVVTVLWSLLSLVPAYLSKVLIDDGIDDGNRDVIAIVAAISAALVVAMWLLTVAQKYYLYDIAYRAVVSMQHLLLDHLVHLPIGYHQRRPVGQSVSRLTNDVMASRKLITSGLPAVITNSVSAIGALTLMFVLDWDMTLVTLLVVPFFMVISHLYRRWSAPLFADMRDRIGDVTSSANSSLGIVALIQSYDQEHAHRAQFARAAQRSRAAELRTVVAGAVYFPASASLVAVANGLLIIYGGTQVVRGNSQVGTMVAFFGYLGMFLGPISQFSTIIQGYQSGVAALAKVFGVVDEPLPTDPTGSGGLPVDATGAVRVEELALDVAGRPVLRGIDLTIEGGSIVAIVGTATSGRAEIARIIAGLQVPRSGHVAYDGIDASSVSPHALSRHIGYVSQETGLFDATVRDNLVLGLPGATDDELLDGLEQLYGADFAELLAHGLDTVAGRNGRDLPAGTRQAIVIARAILRQPRILVLDGAVDSLDAGALARLARSRETLLRGVTIVAATNQPLIADYADQVVVLEAGRIVEQGTPRDLLAHDSRFAELSRSWRAGLTLDR